MDNNKLLYVCTFSSSRNFQIRKNGICTFARWSHFFTSRRHRTGRWSQINVYHATVDWANPHSNKHKPGYSPFPPGLFRLQNKNSKESSQ